MLTSTYPNNTWNWELEIPHPSSSDAHERHESWTWARAIKTWKIWNYLAISSVLRELVELLLIKRKSKTSRDWWSTRSKWRTLRNENVFISRTMTDAIVWQHLQCTIVNSIAGGFLLRWTVLLGTKSSGFAQIYFQCRCADWSYTPCSKISYFSAGNTLACDPS